MLNLPINSLSATCMFSKGKISQFLVLFIANMWTVVTTNNLSEYFLTIAEIQFYMCFIFISLICTYAAQKEVYS